MGNIIEVGFIGSCCGMFRRLEVLELFSGPATDIVFGLREAREAREASRNRTGRACFFETTAGDHLRLMLFRPLSPSFPVGSHETNIWTWITLLMSMPGRQDRISRLLAEPCPSWLPTAYDAHMLRLRVQSDRRRTAAAVLTSGGT